MQSLLVMENCLVLQNCEFNNIALWLLHGFCGWEGNGQEFTNVQTPYQTCTQSSSLLIKLQFSFKQREVKWNAYAAKCLEFRCMPCKKWRVYIIQQKWRSVKVSCRWQNAMFRRGGTLCAASWAMRRAWPGWAKLYTMLLERKTGCSWAGLLTCCALQHKGGCPKLIECALTNHTG